MVNVFQSLLESQCSTSPSGTRWCFYLQARQTSLPPCTGALALRVAPTTRHRDYTHHPHPGTRWCTGRGGSTTLPRLAAQFAARDGFSINAAVGCKVHERSKLERLCRYMARPPIAEERLCVDGDGLVVFELKRTFSDGTTHVLFEPHDFIARLAALVPRPRAHLVRYHGLFAPNARYRHLFVTHNTSVSSAAPNQNTREPPTAPMTWMARLTRAFGIELSTCPKCGGKLRVIGEVTQPDTIARILKHVHARQRRDRGPRAPPVSLAN